MRGSDGKLFFSEKEGGKVLMDYLERLWIVEGDAVEGPVVCVGREEVLQALNEMKTGKGPDLSEVSLELIAASGGAGIQVMADICLRVLARCQLNRL